jgi:peptide/nickel transport system ATP-binding protein
MGTNINASTLLEVKHLSVDYYADNGTVHAVDNVDLTLSRGEIMGLAGESGSGKSTLAYAIARLLRPPAMVTDGEVLYYPPAHEADDRKVAPVTVTRLSSKNGNSVGNGNEPVDIMQLSATQLRAFRWNELSIVFQSAMNALNPVMNIGDQIMDALKAHRPNMGPDAQRRRAIELLQLVGISPDRIRSYPHELSGGMRQRAVIAIALALRPELIIMDEPTTALDVVVQREILELVKALCREFNTALIFITHDLSLLLELADKIAIMYAGRMVEKATSMSLYQHPRHPYSYGLLNSFPSIRGPRRRMVGIPGSPPDLRNVPSGCAFHPRCPMAFGVCTTTIPSQHIVVSSSSGGSAAAVTNGSGGRSVNAGPGPRTVDAGSAGQLVACHLYDSWLNPAGPPSSSDFAARYEAMEATAEGSKLR